MDALAGDPAAREPGGGALAGLRVIELGGKGPVPFAGMVLADMGAEVVRCERPAGPNGLAGVDILERGKRVLRLDLKSREAACALLDALGGFDVVLDGLRPGASERLGLGAEIVRGRHPRVVYGQMSGYGRGNTRSAVAGHDINFLAAGTALAHIGREGEAPTLPLNLVADFGGGGMLLVVGVMAALLERAASGQGQVVDAAMADGVAYLMASVYGMNAAGMWHARGTNLLDGGCPFYNVYATADARYVTVGALEPSQYRQLLEALDLSEELLEAQFDRWAWPALTDRFRSVFAAHPRAYWDDRFAALDACYAPVITMAEAPLDPFHRERGTFVEVDGVVQPAPAPRFNRTPSLVRPARPSSGGGLEEDLLAVGFSKDAAQRLIELELVA